MIVKGNSRGGALDLGKHLLKTLDDDGHPQTVTIVEMRGMVSDDLIAGFLEMEAIAGGTKCTQHMYSCSINPSEKLTHEQYMQIVEEAEQRLGLTGQARAVVYHDKKDREHMHVVWSRIDIDQMKAVQLSFDHQTLRGVARDMALKFGHELPEGLKFDRGNDRFRKDNNQAEQKQKERTGLDPKRRKAVITELFRTSQSSDDFLRGLDECGYLLARGDGRSFVIVDRAGDIHSLAKQIDGAQVKDVRTYLNPLKPEDLPYVHEARKFLINQGVQRKPVANDNKITRQALKRKHSIELKVHRADYKAVRGRLKEKEAEDIAGIKERIVGAFKSDWRQLFKEQEDAAQVLKDAGRNVITRLRFLLNSKGMDRFQPEFKRGLSNVFNWVVRGKLEGAALEKKFARQRRALGDAQKLAERTEVKAIRDDYKAQRRELSEQQKDDRQILKDKHDEEIRQLEVQKDQPTADQVLMADPLTAKTAGQPTGAAANLIEREVEQMKEQEARERAARAKERGHGR